MALIQRSTLLRTRVHLVRESPSSVQREDRLRTRVLAVRLVAVGLIAVGLRMTPGTPILDPPFSRNFRRLVLGCIKTDFYNQILILQDFSRSTRFTFLCTAPNSNFQQKFIKLFDIFYWNICKFCKILIKIIIFRTDFDEILSEFHEIWWFS